MTQEQVKALTTRELQEVESEIKKAIGSKVLEWHPLERRDINGKTYLFVHFVRTSPTVGQSTYVEIYQLQDTDKSVNFSLEYRLSDKALWDPICRMSLLSLLVGSTQQKH